MEVQSERWKEYCHHLGYHGAEPGQLKGGTFMVDPANGGTREGNVDLPL